MKNIADFLYRCIAEDERVADHGLKMGVSQPWLTGGVWIGAGHTPAMDAKRLKAECEAKRRIIERHPVSRNYIAEGSVFDAEPRYIEGTLDIPFELLILAQPYSDRPGFDESWRIR